MAFTVIVLRGAAAGTDLLRSTLFFSQEYLPQKERDPSGAVLPNQEWQHPQPDELHYCEIGTLAGDERVTGLVDMFLNVGTSESGGHVRILFLEDCPWLKDRLETWGDRQARAKQEYAEEQRERQRQEMAKAPVYKYCEQCGEETEQCKGPEHRGRSRCMTCGGGPGDLGARYCVNCVDLPYRERREATIGQPIVYLSEEPPISEV